MENTTRRCGDFPSKPIGSDLEKAQSPLTTFARKKKQHPSATYKVERLGKRSRSAKPKNENKKGGKLRKARHPKKFEIDIVMRCYKCIFASNKYPKNMKSLCSLYKVLALFIISLGIFSSCVTLRPANVTLKKDISQFTRVYIPSTQTVHGSTAVVVSGVVLPYSQSVNPRDVIAGMLSKKGYVILSELDERFREETIIVNYGESDRRNSGLREYTIIEVTLQFISAATGELLCTTTAEGRGMTEAEAVKQAVTRALKAVFK